VRGSLSEMDMDFLVFELIVELGVAFFGLVDFFDRLDLVLITLLM